MDEEQRQSRSAGRFPAVENPLAVDLCKRHCRYLNTVLVDERMRETSKMRSCVCMLDGVCNSSSNSNPCVVGEKKKETKVVPAKRIRRAQNKNWTSA